MSTKRQHWVSRELLEGLLRLPQASATGPQVMREFTFITCLSAFVSHIRSVGRGGPVQGKGAVPAQGRDAQGRPGVMQSAGGEGVRGWPREDGGAQGRPSSMRACRGGGGGGDGGWGHAGTSLLSQKSPRRRVCPRGTLSTRTAHGSRGAAALGWGPHALPVTRRQRRAHGTGCLPPASLTRPAWCWWRSEGGRHVPVPSPATSPGTRP